MRSTDGATRSNYVALALAIIIAGASIAMMGSKANEYLANIDATFKKGAVRYSGHSRDDYRSAAFVRRPTF